MNENQQIDDYSRNPVPQEKTLSGTHIALVVIGGTIGIPAFLMSANLGAVLGLSNAVLAFSLGCFVLGILGALTSLSGARTHLSTYMLIEFTFGRIGAKFVNFIIALSLIGWYGVIINVFAQAANLALIDILNITLPLAVYIVIGSVLMGGVTIAGFMGIDKLAIALVPLMIVFLIYAAVLSYDQISSWDTINRVTDNFSFVDAVSAVIGSYIAGVVIQPDYSRFAKSGRHAFISVFIALGISFPIILTLSAIPAVATAEYDLIKIMIVLGIGIPAFSLLLLSSWSSNVLCLYSSSLSMSTIFMRFHLWKITVVITILGTVLAFLEINNYLIAYLLLLGIAIPPIASIYVLETLIFRKSVCNVETLPDEPSINVNAFIAWLAGIAIGVSTQNQIFSLTSIAAIDTIIVSTVCYFALVFRQKKIQLNITNGVTNEYQS